MKDDVSRIVESIGGAENIQSATHCVTRIRLILKDQSKVNVEALDNIDLVKGNFLAGGQFQIVIGTNVGKVYDEFIKQTNAKEVSRNDMKEEIVRKTESSAASGKIVRRYLYSDHPRNRCFRPLNGT